MGTDPPEMPATGVVEVFDHEQVGGWVESVSGSPPVRVTLWANDVEADATFAVDAGQRHADGDVRMFDFTLADLWDFVGPDDRLTVRADGRPIPISGHGGYVVPTAQGAQSVAELRTRLDGGEVFGRAGMLQLSKQLDTDWQTAALKLYRRVGAEVRDSFGYDLFLAYGTLLGMVREGGFIGHDLDFDGAFVASHHDGAGAASELQDVAFDLIDKGFAVRAGETSLSVWDPEQESVRLNVFHVYTDADGSVHFPFGVAGSATLNGWAGTTQADFNGAAVLVPVEPETVLEHLYGAGWRSPNPGFSWARDRVPDADDAGAALPAAVIEEIYWSDFYARTSYTSGSTFFELVNARADLPTTVIDVGCGDGRDSFAFAAAGRTATGIDRSHVGVRHAARKAEQLGHDQLFFSACDVGDAERLHAALTAARGQDPEQPVAFYARFFLHSIPEDVQRMLLATIDECSRPGDYFAAEFRTDKDEQIEKVHGNHYRRFQNGPAFGRSLHENYGFEVLLEQEGNGFSPYKGEDPQLYRVIARREG